MNDVETNHQRSRVPLTTVLASIVGMWACYFVLTTVRAEILDLGFEIELLWRRAVVALVGVGITLGMWLVLRLFDLRPLWMQISAALIVAAPVSVLLAQVNTMAFYDVEAQVLDRMGEKQGVRVRRDESGNLLVDVPLAPLPPVPPVPPVPPAGDTSAEAAPGTPSAPETSQSEQSYEATETTRDIPDSIRLASKTAQETHMQQLTEIALGRYFLMLAWCALYLALVAGEQARSAERREGAFRRAAKAAELRSLRYQVNPHFLFNTLNSLSALVLTGRNRQAETMIQTISTFYRHSLADDPTSDVPLREEFALQRMYLDIEEVRFPDRLIAEYDLPEELANARVPGMILQPLVENSVKHAVAPSSHKVTITLSAREEDGRLVVSVRDNGKAGETSDKPRPGYGIGLANVRERLEARFGDQASMVSGKTAQGYATQIRIPLVTHG